MALDFQQGHWENVLILSHPSWECHHKVFKFFVRRPFPWRRLKWFKSWCLLPALCYPPFLTQVWACWADWLHLFQLLESAFPLTPKLKWLEPCAGRDLVLFFPSSVPVMSGAYIFSSLSLLLAQCFTSGHCFLLLLHTTHFFYPPEWRQHRPYWRFQGHRGSSKQKSTENWTWSFSGHWWFLSS